MKRLRDSGDVFVVESRVTNVVEEEDIDVWGDDDDNINQHVNDVNDAIDGISSINSSDSHYTDEREYASDSNEWALSTKYMFSEDSVYDDDDINGATMLTSFKEQETEAKGAEEEKESSVQPYRMTQQQLAETKERVRNHMEDVLGLMSTLTPDELHPLYVTFRRRLDTQYIDCHIEVTRRFVALCGDVIVEKVLGALARSESLAFMLAMRTVSTQWCKMVGHVDHVNVQYVKKPKTPVNNNTNPIQNNKINNYYHQFVGIDEKRSTDHGPNIECHVRLLCSLFPRVTSIQCSLYMTSIPPYLLGELCGRVTALQVNTLGWTENHAIVVGGVNHTPSLIHWDKLDTLVLPPLGGCVIKGLETLVHLTRLQVLNSGLFTDNVLKALTSLAHLTLRGASARMDLSPAALPRLTYLGSDQPSHFHSFTGHGNLKSDIEEQQRRISSPENRAKQEDFDVYEPGCCSLDCGGGSWFRGRYSGPIDMSYWCKNSPSREADAIGGWSREARHRFIGHMVDGQMSGAGKEYMNEEQLFEGEWLKGKRHGAGKLTKRTYQMSGRIVCDANDPLHYMRGAVANQNTPTWSMHWTLYSEQVWEQGRLIKEKVVGNPALFL